MNRAFSLTIAMAVLCASVAAQIPSSALAAAPQGSLSKVEYQHLSKWLADIKLSDKKSSLQDEVNGCKALGTSTALLRQLRATCAADTTATTDLITLYFAQQDCTKAATNTTTSTTTTPTTGTTGTTTMMPTTTTTTGTTTTPTVSGLSSTQLEVYVCLAPVYQYTSLHAATMYAQDTLARKVAAGRGLTGVCLNTLVASTKQLKDDSDMAAAEKRVVADDALLAKFERGQLPASAVKGGAIASDLRDYARALSREAGADSTPEKLSTCPHA
jgi:hypothetical protein